MNEQYNLIHCFIHHIIILSYTFSVNVYIQRLITIDILSFPTATYMAVSTLYFLNIVINVDDNECECDENDHNIHDEDDGDNNVYENTNEV